jgi:hypothetical protein
MGMSTGKSTIIKQPAQMQQADLIRSACFRNHFYLPCNLLISDIDDMAHEKLLLFRLNT